MENKGKNVFTFYCKNHGPLFEGEHSLVSINDSLKKTFCDECLNSIPELSRVSIKITDYEIRDVFGDLEECQEK